ncbi:MAG TPA: 2,3-bisphosphoglycerate-independent phosphoglycerate mutase [Candidatus Omnitrophota bacterium]|nr:2,3-bisphosphoglycerate-independent phosphoglycerate mutase [Candidatus Omnitrophota bacterium]
MSFSLKKLKNFHGRPGPLLLIIMDGIGIGKQDESDGVYMAKTPVLDQLFKSGLYATLQAHGTAVGMPSDDDMGNSEVGHNALGAGRVFAQGAALVNQAIAAGAIFTTPTWSQLVGRVAASDKIFHLIGLLSDGNVHAHVDHLFAILRRLAQDGVRRARVHVLLDGRDVYEKSALIYIEQTEKLLRQLNEEYGVDYRIASGGGRMVTTMDRYNADWSIVKRGWDAHVLGEGRMFSSAQEAVTTYYNEDPSITDQYLDSFVIAENGVPVGTIQDGDSVVFYNFRGDRAMELSRAFEEKDFKEFDRVRVPEVLYAGMMEYDGDQHVPKYYLVNPPQIERPVSVYLCGSGVTSFAISETQKFGHVTYFWNGNNSGYIDEQLEKYDEVPSDKVRFDTTPQMKAREITDLTIQYLRSGKYQFGRINFPNGDMVGHTGVPKAIITAVETVDTCVGKLIEVVKELSGIVVITADHGNADEMYTVKKGKKIVSTAHSLNPVPFVIIDKCFKNEYNIVESPKRGLSNVAATLLNLLGYEKPDDYDPSLIAFNR